MEEYFTFVLDMKLSFAVKMESENLELSFEVDHLKLDGIWAPSYQPKDKTFIERMLRNHLNHYFI